VDEYPPHLAPWDVPFRHPKALSTCHGASSEHFCLSISHQLPLLVQQKGKIPVEVEFQPHSQKILQAKLEQLQEEKEANALTQERRSQVKTADRSEKIRTYNVLQDRVTDHRIKKSWHGIERILGGDIKELLSALLEIPQKA